MIRYRIILVIALILLSIVNPIETEEMEKRSIMAESASGVQVEEFEEEEQQSGMIAEENQQQGSEALDALPKSDDAFVRAADYIPNVFIDLKYASEDNFTGTVIYEFDSAYLRYGTAKKLAGVAEEIDEDGYALKIWDAYRPAAAQFKLWSVCPNSKYVANPNAGFSSHSRGNTVDITLVTLDGSDVEMPTGFDDFSIKADRDYSDCSEMEAQNARYLENMMIKHGFKAYQGEWWHYADVDGYLVEEDFMPD